MYCYECGTELIDGECPKCTQQGADISYNNVREAKNAEVFSIIALIAGILSIAGQGLIYGIVGIIFATLYKNRVGEYNDMAKIGKNLAIAGIIISGVVVVLLITFYICLYAGIIVMGGLYA